MHSNRPISPFRMPFLRSSTSPLPRRPASPVLPSPQDCAFPPFPAARSKDTIPTIPLESSFSFLSDRASPQERVDTAPGLAALRPLPKGSGNLIQRMDRIAPGPFNIGENRHAKPSGHSKSPSMGNSRDFVRVSRSTSPKLHVQRPSTSSSNYMRNPSLVSTSTASRPTLDRSTTEMPTTPSVPRPFFQDQSDGSAHVPLPSFDFGSFRQGTRSPALSKNDGAAALSEPRPTMERIHSESSSHSHKPRPSVAVAAMQPLHEIGGTSSFKPSRSVRSRAVSPAVDKSRETPSAKAHATVSRDDQRLGGAPPVPIQPAEVFGHDSAYHRLHESTSSNGSGSSAAKSSSSISTPHESTSSNESYGFAINGGNSSPPPKDPLNNRIANASDENQASDMFKGFVFDVEQPSRLENTAPIQDEHLVGYLQLPRINAPAPVRPTKPNFPSHEDALVEEDSPISPDEYIISSFAPQLKNLRVTPVPTPYSRYPESAARRRPPPVHKGNCRGCGDLIYGKSVSSADGRLTGRYHKQCFVCQTCQKPFQTADFYVMNNQPYCARHYHELNDSLCTNCDRGIEGQYLETELKQKFHPHCFSCQECHIILRDDYYEFSGRTLCEQHAFGAARTSTPSSLGPGRRFPERRTTRLMMM